MDKIEEYRIGRILLIDKPSNWTSFDVVNKIRYQLKCKVGHGGTLDPLATGLLIIATGKKTKELQNIQAKDKTYTGIINLGHTTPSYDLETEFDKKYPTNHITKEMIIQTAIEFTGNIEQTPPKYSALKINGKRAYKRARNQEDFEMKKRLVTIHSFEIIDMNMPKIKFKLSCSKGTYIRSIAHDFGKHLGSGAYLSNLRRVKIDNYDIENALSINDFIESLNQKKEIED